jgi:hypothetical protein
MPSVGNLPDPTKGVDALLELADIFGDRYVFDLIRAIRFDRPGPTGLGTATDASHQLAQRLLTRLRAEDPSLTYEAAKRRLADQLGYTDLTRTNFYKILQGIPRPKGNGT